MALENERDRVIDVLERTGLANRVRRVEHAGSTAVPELAAKDIVDLDIVVEDDAVAKVADTLETDPGGTRYENAPGWNLVFREEYEQLKREQTADTDELETYSGAKTAFIERLLDGATHQNLGLDFEIPASR